MRQTLAQSDDLSPCPMYWQLRRSMRIPNPPSLIEREARGQFAVYLNLVIAEAWEPSSTTATVAT
jgi:hypothetical protein